MNIPEFLALLVFGLRDLFRFRTLVFIMSLTIAIATTMYMFLEVYRSGLAAQFNEPATSLLVIHDSQNVGDISGSRVSGDVSELLSSMGISMLIPEIRAVTGTSVQNATLLRGIDLVKYTSLESFSMLSGRRLKPNDPPRQAMVGALLAETQGLSVGDKISLRGRNFSIVGIFENGTYMDNQAWISLADAQVLLGWEKDVSVFIIPDEGILHEGDILPGNLSVSRKGEDLRLISAQYEPLLRLWQIVALALGIAASLTLANVLWRLAWLRRHEIAILRTVAFSTPSIVGYLLIQAAGVTLLGLLLGGFFMMILVTSTRLTVSSLTIVPRLEAFPLLANLGAVGLIVLAGSLIPAWWLSHLNLAQLLRSE